MGQLVLLTIGALAVGAIGFGVAVLLTGSDPGLVPVESESQPVPLPADRPLAESDLARIRFDTAIRGYRMAQVDSALRRVAYDVGYKLELIGVLEAEVEALRDGRQADADKLHAARMAAAQAISGDNGPSPAEASSAEPAGADGADQQAGAGSADQPAGDGSADQLAGAGSADAVPPPHRPEEIRR